MDNNITLQLAKLIEEARVDDENTINNTKKLIVDYISASYAGYQYNRKFNQAIEEIYLDGTSSQGASVFLFSKKIPVLNAAFLNAVYAHGADMDDGHRRAMGHVGASVISAVFALADSIQVEEKDVLLAIIVGYQIYVNLSASVQPGMVERGFHSTGTAGAVACAGACAILLKLNAAGIASAISLGATQASGLLIVGESGQLVKPLSPAKAAEAGVLAALLAQKGIVGPSYPLESTKGWIHAMSEQFNEQKLFEHFSSFSAVNECYVKPYPSCRHTHCGIEAAVKLYPKIECRDINKIYVYTYKNAIYLAGMKPVPKNIDEAKFSIQYTLACAIIYGEFGLEHLDPMEIDQKVYDVIPKIELICDPKMEDYEAGIRGAKVVIIDGQNIKYEETVLQPKGEPETPFTWNDIAVKLHQCASGIISSEEEQRIIKNIMELGKNKIFCYSDIFI